ncbi:MAG: redox-regulated ATPase YchF [Dehalococcoidia bacterium]
MRCFFIEPEWCNGLQWIGNSRTSIKAVQMTLSCGLVGLPGCGKTTIFNAVTAAGAGCFDGSEMNRAVINVPDPRLDRLVEMYRPRKVVPATVEVVDIPGLRAGSTVGEGRGARLLGHIKDVDALLHVVRCFEDETVLSEYAGIDPGRDVETVELELVVADSQTLQNKIERLQKKSKAGDQEVIREKQECEKVKAGLEEGIPARKQILTESELASIRECNLLSIKPVLYIANIKSLEDESNAPVKTLQSIADAEGAEMIAVCGRDEAEIAQLEPEEQGEFLNELGLEESSMQRLIRAAYRLLGLVSFFTTGSDEVRAWTCHHGDMAPVAAGKIHTDMERGFIRMEVIRFDDLAELGSEAAVARAGRQRLEGKNYEVQDGDIVTIRFSPPK